MADKQTNPLTPRDLCRIVFRHKWKASFVFLATVAGVVAFLLFCPRTYASRAKLFIRVGRENVALDPTATTGPFLPVETKLENQTISMLELIGSRTVFEKTVDSVGVDEVLARSGKAKRRPNILSRLTEMIDPVTDREKAIRRLEKGTRFWTEDNSRVVVAEYLAKTPGLAQRVTQTLVDVYLEEHVCMNKTSGSYAFFAEQSAVLAERLARATESLRDAKNEIGLLSIESQRDILRDRIAAVKGDLIRSEAAMAASQSQIAALKERLVDLPEQIVLSEVEGLPNAAADEMHKQLYDLQIAEAGLSTAFVDGYRPLEAVREQVDLATKILDRQEPRRIQQTSGVNPTYQSLHLTLLSAESDLEARRAESRSLREQYALAEAEVKLLNTSEARLRQLEREVAMLGLNYESYSEKREQSRIDEELDQKRISNVNVVQPATFEPRPVSPGKGTTLALGLVLAMAGAGLVIAVSEFLDRTLKTPADVEGTLDLPVFLSVPRSSRRRVVLNC